MNKYDSLSTDALIRAIQRVARQLDSNEVSKMASDRKATMQKDLSEMRAAVIPRLQKENRNNAKFFRLDTHIRYHKIQVIAIDDWDTKPVPDRYGIVTGHVDGRVLVQFYGEGFSTLCWPQDLIIRYIRP